jgi:hypothetical protein
VRDIATDQLDLYDDMELRADGYLGIERAALKCLPLPRWARIEQDAKRKVRLVLLDGRSMEEFAYYLEHGRSPRRVSPRPSRALAVLLKYANRRRRTPSPKQPAKKRTRRKSPTSV